MGTCESKCHHGLFAAHGAHGAGCAGAAALRPNGHQLFFASPMTAQQMEVLGFEPPQTCPEDVNGDNVVDVLDLLSIIAAWGQSGVPEDINGNGAVDVLDLLAVIAAWGPC